MVTITADRVRDALRQAGITHIAHHPCGLCGYMTAYLIDAGSVVFDAGCDCVARDGREPRSFQDIADWINRQTNGQSKRRLLERCGLHGEGTP